MADWSLSAGGVPYVLAVTPAFRGSANAKGSWVQIVSSTTDATDLMVVQLAMDSGSGGGQCFLVDIGMGGVGSEVVIVPNLLLDCSRGIGQNGFTLALPIEIPSGVRISARCQEPGGAGSRSVNVGLTLYSGGWNMDKAVAGSVVDYGTNTGTSNGTLIDQGGTAGTFGSWVQLTASTSVDHNTLSMVFGLDQQTSAPATSNFEVEIAIGGSGSEQRIGRAAFAMDSGSNGSKPNGFIIPVQIPSGTRIAARSKSTSAGSADRHLTMAVYGA